MADSHMRRIVLPGSMVMVPVPAAPYSSHVDTAMFDTWKLVNTLWDPEVYGYPPQYVKLCDAWIYKTVKTVSLSNRAAKWLYNFNARGHIRHTRMPVRQTVWLISLINCFRIGYRESGKLEVSLRTLYVFLTAWISGAWV